MSDDIVLRGLSEIRQHFFRNEIPTYYIDAFNFNLMGLDEWVRRFRYINYNDCFDGTHPNIVIPQRELSAVYPFERLEALNNYLLTRPEVQEYITTRGPGLAVLLYFNEETVSICTKLGLEIIFPALSLRREMDSKVGGTRMADGVGVPSVPNVLGQITNYSQLRDLAGHLGEQLVIQTPFGDSGETTFFVSNETDWLNCAAVVEREPEVKVMRRIRCRPAAMEGCVTRNGTIVGPLLTEVVGFPELTPYQGGWAGNEVCPDAFDAAIRQGARQYTEKLGHAMARRGYRGYFEVDYLFDIDAEVLYLGEINPRISGASSMTNLAAFAHADAPLFLFHLLEFSGHDFEIDTGSLNDRWSDPRNIDPWGNFLIKHLDQQPHVVSQTPSSGVWQLTDDGMHYLRMQTHRRTVDRDDEAFLLRIAAPGDVVSKGDELVIIALRGRVMDAGYQLSERALRWIEEVRAAIVSRPC